MSLVVIVLVFPTIFTIRQIRHYLLSPLAVYLILRVSLQKHETNAAAIIRLPQTGVKREGLIRSTPRKSTKATSYQKFTRRF